MTVCDKCGQHVLAEHVPPEPPVGTWMKDRYGAVTYHQTGGWAQPGFMPLGVWPKMWEARGPYVECGPWGAPL